jgi:hypothetical protein
VATINPTYDNPTRGEYIVTWASMANGDVGAPARVGHVTTTRSVQLVGTLGVGGNCRLRVANMAGTPSGSDWITANDPQGNPLDMSTLKIEELLEGSSWYSPSITAGDGTTLLTVRLRCYGGR